MRAEGSTCRLTPASWFLNPSPRHLQLDQALASAAVLAAGGPCKCFVCKPAAAVDFEGMTFNGRKQAPPTT